MSIQSECQKALELLANDQWDESHELVQKGQHQLHFLIHALQHRIEGDLSNAQYWYNRAEVSFPDNSIPEESQRLQALVQQLES